MGTEATRLTEKMSTDRAALDELLDTAVVAHVGLVVDGGPLVVPTAIGADGDTVLVHGSTGSSWMRALAAGADACLTVTALDGLVVARSAFESSLHYRSAVLFGRCTPVADDAKQRALDLVTEQAAAGPARRVASGRRRASWPRRWCWRCRSTMVAARCPTGGRTIPAEDVAGDAWAGVVPLTAGFGEPRAGAGPARRASRCRRPSGRCNRLERHPASGAVAQAVEGDRPGRGGCRRASRCGSSSRR